MKIDHIAIWTKNLEELRSFYMKYFQASSNKKYFNPTKKFSSYFLTFDEGCTIEIMEMPNIPDSQNNVYTQFQGIIHIAFHVGSKIKVENLTNKLKTDGYRIIGQPRITGDGFYESVILDPEGNRIEILA